MQVLIKKQVKPIYISLSDIKVVINTFRINDVLHLKYQQTFFQSTIKNNKLKVNLKRSNGHVCEV